ncbi:hypothetical protein [Streptomyces sp. NEAU-YJ-81]|uniref:hypothetical protein n=1 Tax=Streptomyces sp. NEAU-YJ-81 TaxID=2820288 RepID=UPI001ABCE909|nr:hypothetical protein [Streptomyces sp. NEAU-YJ-81]MBO3680314.1 hypothetical protein [Streptomyces sp. NEAU-YJ-81]
MNPDIPGRRSGAVLHRDRLDLRIHDGAFSSMNLTARHPRTVELPAGTERSAHRQASQA